MNISSLSGFIFILLGGLVAMLNGLTVFQNYRSGKFRSTIPLIGSLFLGIGLYLFPKTRPYTWLAVFLDPGTVSLLFVLPKAAREFWLTSRFNLEREYAGRSGSMRVRLQLFRKNVFTLRVDMDQTDKLAAGLISAGMIGTWSIENGRINLHSEGQDAVFERLPDAHPESCHLVEGLVLWPCGAGMSLADVVLVLKQPSE